MMYSRFWFAGAIAAAPMILGMIEVRAEPRAVVELFTSQGCSSCPAADNVLGELKKDSSLIPLSLPIDYWDYLGWKDTLAKPRHAARQKAYSHMRGDREIYTPQVVINGTVQALGSDKGAIERAVARSRTSGTTMSVPVSVSVANGRLTVATPSGKGESAGEVWLFGVAKSLVVRVARGENRGRDLTYNNVVRQWMKLGAWNGRAQTWTVPLGDIKQDDVDAVAVIVQSGSVDQPGPVLGAAMAALN
jgi:hypothetical protein